MADKIIVRGAREHNLRNVSVDLPRDKLIVFTGLSGSGKSSLAFDTIYAEGQRRYVESLSAYARQFLGQMDKPDVDVIEGLSPAISIDQKSASRNPRSTVGTITEVYDYLRLLYARIGIQHCPNDGTRLQRQTPQQIVDRILLMPDGTRFQVLAPVVRGRKGEYKTLLEDLAGQGFVRARVDTELVDIAEFLKRDESLARYENHSIEVVIDRLVRRDGIERRLTDSLETALKLADGVAEAVDFFINQPAIARYMQTLVDVGLGYVRLGQPAPTLSGGEAQRVKLSAELAKRSTGHTIYLLDEPTTGLHFEDVRRLLTVLSRLVDQGNTVLVIEHNLDVIKTADWVIDLGPEGGNGGGLIVGEGPPEHIASLPASHTGHFLKPLLGV